VIDYEWMISRYFACCQVFYSDSGDHPNTATSPQHMHAHSQLTHRHEPLLHCQERMSLVGVDHLTRAQRRRAMLRLRRRGQGQIYQVMIVVDPDVQAILSKTESFLFLISTLTQSRSALVNGLGY